MRPADHPELEPLDQQILYLTEALGHNEVAQALLSVAAELSLPDWYFGAGGVAHTVWNLRHGFDAAGGIKDYDLVYFDPDDLSDESRLRVEREVQDRLARFDVEIDVQNEARVHLWYGTRFGREIEPYRSTEHAITTWPTTASSVGVRLDGSGAGLVVFAPFGLTDLLGMVARPNKAIISRDIYEEKVARWSARWPRLQVVPW